MNKKVFIYVAIACLLALFAFGSIYTPKAETVQTVALQGKTVTEEAFASQLIQDGKSLTTLDYVLVVLYAVLIVALGLFASRTTTACADAFPWEQGVPKSVSPEFVGEETPLNETDFLSNSSLQKIILEKCGNLQKHSYSAFLLRIISLKSEGLL